MLPSTVEKTKVIIQSVSVVLSILINSLLIFLIIKKSPKKMGTYRHLMMFFCCCSMFFASMDIIVRPAIHTYKSAFFMVMDLRDRSFPVWLSNVLICTLGGCFGVTIYGIAIHFIYRLFALERQGRLRYFKSQYLPFWLAIPILGGVGWFLVCLICFPMDSIKTSFYREPINETYGMDIDQAAYAGGLFYAPEGETNYQGSTLSFIGFSLFILIMVIPFLIILISGGKSLLKIKELLKLGESSFTRNLQMQLYKALVAQTVIPVFLLFIPFGTIFICPILEINCQFLSAPITFIYAFYPVLDPLPIIYFVDSYRNTISEFFNGQCGLCKKQSRIQPHSEESRSQPSISAS